MKYPTSRLTPFPPTFPRKPPANPSTLALRFLACPFSDFAPKSFIYRFYAESPSKSFIYRIYVSAPGWGVVPILLSSFTSTVDHPLLHPRHPAQKGLLR